MQKNNIEKLVNETLQSFDGAAKAEAKPFLLTRIMARMNNDTPNIWAKAVLFLSRPIVAFVGLLLILMVNAAIIFSNVNADDSEITVQNIASSKDEFTAGMASIYDLENQEP